MLPEGARFPLNAKVRFTQERLAVLMPQDRKRLEGRIGIVQGYWNYSRKPIVYFAEEGNRPELRLLRVDPRQLEPVDESAVDASVAQADAGTDGNRKLSQSELDEFFN